MIWKKITDIIAASKIGSVPNPLIRYETTFSRNVFKKSFTSLDTT